MLALRPYARPHCECLHLQTQDNAVLKRPARVAKFCIGPERLVKVVRGWSERTAVPEPIEDGCGGVYKIGSPGVKPEDLTIFKPFDEEVSTTGHMGFIKEYAAFILDDGMAGVPETGIACLPWKNSSGSDTVKLGAIQKYITGESAADFGPAVFNTDDVHRIGILDLRILNLDRHSGNMLYCKETGKLLPIDHGLSFPSAFTDLGRTSFDWLLYPNAKEPFSPEILKEIERIDVYRDLCVLQTLGISVGSQLALWMSTMLLKIGASAGLTLYEIGCLVQRQGDRNELCVLEQLFGKALQIVKMYKANFWSVFLECIYCYLAIK